MSTFQWTEFEEQIRHMFSTVWCKARTDPDRERWWQGWEFNATLWPFQEFNATLLWASRGPFHQSSNCTENLCRICSSNSVRWNATSIQVRLFQVQKTSPEVTNSNSTYSKHAARDMQSRKSQLQYNTKKMREGCGGVRHLHDAGVHTRASMAKTREEIGAKRWQILWKHRDCKDQCVEILTKRKIQNNHHLYIDDLVLITTLNRKNASNNLSTISSKWGT